MALRLTMGFSDNPRAQPLKDGVVKLQGIELDCITLDPSNLFQRNLTYDKIPVGVPVLSRKGLSGAGGGLRRGSVSHRAPCHG